MGPKSAAGEASKVEHRDDDEKLVAEQEQLSAEELLGQQLCAMLRTRSQEMREMQNEVKELRKGMIASREEEKEVAATNVTLEERVQSLEETNKTFEKRNQNLTEEVQSLKEEVQSLKEENQSLKESSKTLTEEVQSVKNDMQKMASEMHHFMRGHQATRLLLQSAEATIERRDAEIKELRELTNTYREGL